MVIQFNGPVNFSGAGAPRGLTPLYSFVRILPSDPSPLRKKEKIKLNRSEVS